MAASYKREMCALCLQSYHPKYFRQHKCINSESLDIYNIPQQRQQENIQNSYSDDPSFSPSADDASRLPLLALGSQMLSKQRDTIC